MSFPVSATCMFFVIFCVKRLELLLCAQKAEEEKSLVSLYSRYYEFLQLCFSCIHNPFLLVSIISGLFHAKMVPVLYFRMGVYHTSIGTNVWLAVISVTGSVFLAGISSCCSATNKIVLGFYSSAVTLCSTLFLFFNFQCCCPMKLGHGYASLPFFSCCHLS